MGPLVDAGLAAVALGRPEESLPAAVRVVDLETGLAVADLLDRGGSGEHAGPSARNAYRRLDLLVERARARLEGR